MNNVNTDAKSTCARGRSPPVRTSPIDPLPEHRELRRGQPNRPLLGARPRKSAPLKNLVIKAKPLAIPIEQLDPIPASPPECKDCATGGFLMQNILSKGRQSSDPFPHIRHAAGQIHANTGARPDHAASTARIKDVSAAGSIVLSKCRQRPHRKRNSTALGGALSTTGDCAAGTPAATGRSIGKNSAPPSGDHRPFFLRSCRQA